MTGGGEHGAGPLVLVLGTADWDAVIATNQHYVTRALAERLPVLFTEGAGTRRLRMQDARRVLRRLRPRAPSGTRRPVPAGVRVLTPRLVPHHGPLTRPANARLLRAQVRRWLQHRGPRVLWTYTPHTYGLQADADVTVYHLVDLLHENPGVDRHRLLAAERALAPHADLAVATSAAIEEHLRRQGFARTLHLPNVADVAVFARAAEEAERAGRGRQPVAVLAGTIAAHKVDLPLLAHLARRLRGTARLRLVGPLAPGATAHPAWPDLLDAGTEVLAPMALDALAAELAGAAVGLVPYRVDGLAAGISPLKTHEYLAAGMPVVSTPLPAVVPVPGAVWVEEGPEAFAQRVLALLAEPVAPARCRAAAAGHDWSARGQRLRELPAQLLAARAR